MNLAPRPIPRSPDSAADRAHEGRCDPVTGLDSLVDSIRRKGEEKRRRRRGALGGVRESVVKCVLATAW